MVVQGFEIKGLDLVQSNMRRVARGYPRYQKVIHSQIGQPIIQRARSRARVRTGRLRNSVELRSTEEAVEIDAGRGIDYAVFQHYGTRHMTGTRFLTEPLQELEDRLVRDYQQLTDRFVDSVWVSNRAF